ncbi:E3 ubiquitin-protein ligase AIP2 [Apostasia shenzhenica]|uniref:E3 ubiquitin-protein ligase AIP2 n=1 Tax=Apostasia shenzhenica TaxID=1088818 RepID=A0A2I0ARI2_9ASPA|nr:E3 ubiquitin-protein ligase AIP2 [Apostasia shenzhenica]
MTSVSELFYSRRSRVDRTTEPDRGLDGLTADRDRHHQFRRSLLRSRRSRRSSRPPRREDCEPSRQYRTPLQSEHVPAHSVNSFGDSESFNNNSNGSIAGNRINRMILIRNGQLPASVLQARARLLERLRGISIRPNREIEATTSGVPWDVDFSELESRRNSVESGRNFSSSLLHSQSPLIRRPRETSLRGISQHMGSTSISWDELSSFGDFIDDFRMPSSNYSTGEVPESSLRYYRPPAIDWEAIHKLPHEEFKDEDSDVELHSDCCICLDRFLQGDELIRLPCGHRFHSACLKPWLKASGDCPYCRSRF